MEHGNLIANVRSVKSLQMFTPHLQATDSDAGVFGDVRYALSGFGAVNVYAILILLCITIPYCS